MNTAILFSAGRGRRLRPITDTLPKPLVCIQQQALIDYHLEKLAASAIQRVLINHAYLGDHIKRHIGRRYHDKLEIIYIPEPPGGLMTGGTILQARAYLSHQPFLAINADIWTHYDFSTLHCPPNSIAHLILVPPPNGLSRLDFGLHSNQQLTNLPRQYLFGGIACYHPSLFEQQSGIRRVCLVPWLREAADNGLATGEVYQGLWFDTGTPKALAAARQSVI